MKKASFSEYLYASLFDERIDNIDMRAFRKCSRKIDRDAAIKSQQKMMKNVSV